MTDVGRRSVSVVRCGFNDNGNTGGAVTFVGDFLVSYTVGTACLFDRAFYVVVRYVAASCLCDKVLQLAVNIRVGTACAYRDGNLLAYFCEDFCLLSIRLLFLVFDIVPFTVSDSFLSPPSNFSLYFQGF